MRIKDSATQTWFVDGVAQLCRTFVEPSEEALQEKINLYLFLPERQHKQLSNPVNDISSTVEG